MNFDPNTGAPLNQTQNNTQPINNGVSQNPTGMPQQGVPQQQPQVAQSVQNEQPQQQFAGQQFNQTAAQPQVAQPAQNNQQPQISDGIDFKKMSVSQKAGACMIIFALFSAYSFLTSFDSGAFTIIITFLEMASSIVLSVLLLLNKKTEATIAGLVLAVVCVVFGIENFVGLVKEIYTLFFDNSLIKYNFKYVFPSITTILVSIVSIVINFLMAGSVGILCLPTLTHKENAEKQKKLINMASFGLIICTLIYIILSIVNVIVATSVYTYLYDFGDTVKYTFRAVFYGILRLLYNTSLGVTVLFLNEYDFKKIKEKFSKKKN